MTANCEPEFHIRSMIWATDLVGIKALLFPSKDVLAKSPPRPMYAIKDAFNKSEIHPPGINSCFRSFNATVNPEIGVYSLMRTARYGVEAIISALHGVDKGDEQVSKGETGDNHQHKHGSGDHSAEMEGPSQPSEALTSEYGRFCRSTGTGDVLKNNRNIGSFDELDEGEWV
ncbi:hypothetical protein DSL72_008511 [Monilinia vaccinii-corymbosi]|uniref:Uncharacterized protein n=1 Tax=Monilinia vaccinii-corymbosi TaxID=61207 RepID=A0A8A3PL30_9HELO|nr:hypothetical protein DSL72_008511 [Monilinia vaccinii-corymbosi]